jgi:hypothetical protein
MGAEWMPMAVSFLTAKARSEAVAGVVAIAPISAGELVAAYGGPEVDADLAVGERSGNCALTGPTIVRALRDIAPGEALTLDERALDLTVTGASRRAFAY